ncbi:MAG: hypothetical protein Fues2KO_37380 [Fuerstiella sp.]
MERQTATSGRNVLHSYAIDGEDLDEISRGVCEFWRSISETYRRFDEVEYLRVELWADSGRLICFASGADSGVRLGHTTCQAIISRFAEEWLAVEELPDEQFDAAADNLNQRFADLSKSASVDAGCVFQIRYFDADSDDEIFESCSRAS